MSKYQIEFCDTDSALCWFVDCWVGDGWKNLQVFASEHEAEQFVRGLP